MKELLICFGAFSLLVSEEPPSSLMQDTTIPSSEKVGITANNPDDIDGFWKSMDEATGFPKCVFAIYKYQNAYFGRIIGSYDKQGHMDDSIYAPKGRAPGVVGKPYYSGLDIIWGLKLKGSRYHGKILDPKKGNIYDAEVWKNHDELVVRGKFLFFGRNEIWPRATSADFPLGFKKPVLGELTPHIPKPK